MRFRLLALAVVLSAAPVQAQPAKPSSPPPAASSSADAELNLPVSLDKIKSALAAPPPAPLRGLNEVPHFKVEITERQRFKLDELVKTLDFKSGPVPPGGLYGYEQQRQMFPAVDNPLRQPYSEFSQPELVTVLTENLVEKYLAGRAVGAVTSAMRAAAEAEARQEVIRAVTEYCAAQPHGGAGLKICANPSAVR